MPFLPRGTHARIINCTPYRFILGEYYRPLPEIATNFQNYVAGVDLFSICNRHLTVIAASASLGYLRKMEFFSAPHTRRRTDTSQPTSSASPDPAECRPERDAIR
jgi:hypothetical protein